MRKVGAGGELAGSGISFGRRCVGMAGCGVEGMVGSMSCGCCGCCFEMPFVSEAGVGWRAGGNIALSFLAGAGLAAFVAVGFAAAVFAAALASRCALVVRLIFTFFIPEVRLSISDA